MNDSTKNIILCILIGGLIGGPIGLIISCKLALYSTLSGSGIGYIISNKYYEDYELNYHFSFETFENIKEKSIKYDSKLIELFKNKKQIKKNIEKIFIDKNHPITMHNKMYLTSLIHRYQNTNIDIFKEYVLYRKSMFYMIINIYFDNNISLSEKMMIYTSMEENIIQCIYPFLIKRCIKENKEKDIYYNKIHDNKDIVNNKINIIKKDIGKVYDMINFDNLIYQISELNMIKIAEYKADHILSMVDMINYQIGNDNKYLLTADILIPLFSYLILKSTIYNPYSELSYIDNLLINQKNESAYMMITLYSSLEYICKI